MAAQKLELIRELLGATKPPPAEKPSGELEAEEDAEETAREEAPRRCRRCNQGELVLVAEVPRPTVAELMRMHPSIGKRPIAPLADRSRARPGRRAPGGASLCRTLAGVSPTLDDRLREAIASRLRRIGTIGRRTWPDTSSSNECRIAPPVSSGLPPSPSRPTATVSIRGGGGAAESRWNGCGTWPAVSLWACESEGAGGGPARPCDERDQDRGASELPAHRRASPDGVSRDVRRGVRCALGDRPRRPRRRPEGR